MCCVDSIYFFEIINSGINIYRNLCDDDDDNDMRMRTQSLSFFFLFFILF